MDRILKFGIIILNHHEALFILYFIDFYRHFNFGLQFKAKIKS